MWILFSIPKCAGERIANELRMHFRRERRNGVVVSLQETLEAGKEDSALTLSDVLQDGFCMEIGRASCRERVSSPV